MKGCKIILYLNLSHTHITDASLRTISKWVGYFIHRHVYTDHHYVSTPHTDASLQTISKSEPHTQTSSSRPSQIQTFTIRLQSQSENPTPHTKIPYFKPTWSTQIQLPGIGNTDSSSLINFEIMCMVTSIDLGSKKNTVINISIWFSLLCIFLVFV